MIHTANNNTYCLVEVTERVIDDIFIDITGGELVIFYNIPENDPEHQLEVKYVSLASGNWHILGKASELSRETKRLIVNEIERGCYQWYGRGNSADTTNSVNYSFTSLMQSLNLKEENTVILRKD